MTPRADHELAAVIAGEAPAPEWNRASDDPRVIAAVEEYCAALNSGRKPDRQAFLAAHADIADALAKCLDGLEFVHAAAPRLSLFGKGASVAAGDEIRPLAAVGDYRIVREIGRGGMGIVYEAEQLSLGRRVALKVLPFAAAMDAKQLQRFRIEAQAAAHLHHQNIVPVYGVGCERGVHYYAMQYIEGQTVATLIRELRILAGLEPSDPSASAAAASALANELASGHWAPAKQPGGEVVRLCGGVDSTGPYRPTASPPHHLTTLPPVDVTPPVAALSTERSGNSPAFFRTVAHLGVQAAEALEHAHSKGVIHRDIKPANVLIDCDGNLWITDFGLARMLSEAGLTMTGDLLGTLRYMSPEQALAKRVTVDHRTDIYSLGVTLYELLTLQPAYDGCDRQVVMRQIAFEEPRLPRRLNKAIPAELEIIVRKAMGKTPAERYATAQELADDLRRFLDDKPIKAKKPTLLDWTRKWARRHQGVVATGIAGLMVAVAILAVSTLLILSAYRTEAKERQHAVDEGQRAVTALYHSYVREAEALRLARRDGYRPKVWQLLQDAIQLDTPDKDINQLRQEALASLGDFVGLEPTTWDEFPADINAIALHPKGGPLAIGLSDGAVLLRDLGTGAYRARLQQHRCSVTALAFIPDGMRLVSGDRGGTIHVWQANANGEWALEGTISATPTAIGPPQRDIPTINSIAISPDGKQFAASLFFSPTAADSWPRIISLWNLGDGTRTASFGQESQWLFSPAFSSDGKFLAAAYCRTTGEGDSVKTEHGVWLRDLVGSGDVRDLPLDTGCLLKVDFSPDAKLLACTFAKGLALFDTSHFQRPRYATRGNDPSTFAFSPNGKLLAITHGLIGQVRLWNVVNESDVAMLRHSGGMNDELQWVACRSDAVVAASRRSVRMWNLAGSGEKLVLAHGKGVPCVAFSPDGTLLASAGKDNEVKIWDPATGQLLQRLTDFAAEVETVAFSSDGRMLAAGDWAGVIHIWEVRPRTRPAAPGDPPIGRQIWSAAPPDHGMGRHLWSIAFSPDGRYFAAAGGSAGAREPCGATLWRIKPDGNHDAGTSLDLHRLPWLANSRPTGCVAFSPDSQLLAWVEWNRTVHLWDLEASRELPFPPVRLAAGQYSVAFHPISKHLIFVADSGLAEAWDVTTGQRAFSFGGEASRHSSYDGLMALSPDGTWLASSYGRFFTVVDKERPKPLIKLPEEQAVIYCFAWSPKRERLAVGSSDGAVAIWNLVKMKTQLDAIGLGW
jgi:WD40 repeat protein/serine/threonine protein kinase